MGSVQTDITSKVAAQFNAVLNKITPITPSAVDRVLAFSEVKSLPKKSFYVREGQTPYSFAFVYKGLFRYYYADKTGHEFTKGFMPENAFISSYSALIQHRESYFTIEALEDAIILDIPYEKWHAFMLQEPGWQHFLIALLEKKETREREFLLLSAEERYTRFLETHPGLDKRIKQHLIASYLGITPVALSRIRKKMHLINPG